MERSHWEKASVVPALFVRSDEHYWKRACSTGWKGRLIMVVVILYTKYVYVRWIGFILRDLVTPRYFTRGHQSQIGHGTARALHAPRVSRCCLPLPLSPPPSPLLRAAPRVGHPRRQRRRRLVMYLPRPYPAQCLSFLPGQNIGGLQISCLTYHLYHLWSGGRCFPYLVVSGEYISTGSNTNRY